jgi:uncharacterized protein
LKVLIEELDRQSCFDLLSRTRLGRLACAQGAQPYVVPFYFTCDDDFLYSFSTVGKKIEWMRANPLVCVEVDEVINSQNWMSVVVQGRYEEMPDTPEWSMERDTAHCLLQQEAMWWEPAYTKKAIDEAVCSLEPVFYRIRMDKITGRRATSKQSREPKLHRFNSWEDGWLQKFLRRLHEIA